MDAGEIVMVNNEENIDCVICLDMFKFMDVLLILNCGHQLHYECAIRLKDKKRCCICKTPVISNAKILHKTPFSFFKSELDFYAIALNSMIFGEILKRKVISIKEDFRRENIDKQYKAIRCFVEKYLNTFRVKILAAINKGYNEVELFSFAYGDLLNGIPVVFLLYGPKDEGLNYFSKCKIPSLIEYIQYRLGMEFSVTCFRKNSKNFIKCAWRVNVLTRHKLRPLIVF